MNETPPNLEASAKSALTPIPTATILIAGASGAIGRQLIPLLSGYPVLGLTRSHPTLIEDLGARAAIVDVYDREPLMRILKAAKPEIVINLLTDLSNRDFDANNRIRRVGTKNLVEAAVACGVRRLVVASVAFDLPPAAADALAAMEETSLESGLDVEILRFGLLWGPGTWYCEPAAESGYIHVHDAAKAVRNAALATH